MKCSKVTVVTLVGMIAGASACQAATSSDLALTASAGILAAPQLSDAARAQIQDKALLKLAAVSVRGWVQESGPVFAQWRAQMKLPAVDSAAASGNVLQAFETARRSFA